MFWKTRRCLIGDAARSACDGVGARFEDECSLVQPRETVQRLADRPVKASREAERPSPAWPNSLRVEAARALHGSAVAPYRCAGAPLQQAAAFAGTKGLDPAAKDLYEVYRGQPIDTVFWPGRSTAD